MKSTSIHSLNADTGLNWWQKPAYLFLNWVNNLFSYINVDPRIKFEKFGGDWQKYWSETYPTSSPARKFCDLFWRTRPWSEIQKELGGQIHVFDTGCGHGNYSLRLWEGISSYTGVDAKRRPNWVELEASHPNFHFIESRSTNILSLIPKETNLFVTQSAIEHFDSDIKFFEQIKEFIDRAQHPVIQIHLFPARATLPLYLFHGFRQYTPRTISKITRLFPQSKISLIGLGGKSSKRLHFKYFTWPVLITRKFDKPLFTSGGYETELMNAVEGDAQSANRSPLFWALIIKN